MLRLIVKVPDTTQTAHDSWQDITHYKTFDMAMPDELAALLKERPAATIMAVEIVPSGNSGE